MIRTLLAVLLVVGCAAAESQGDRFQHALNPAVGDLLDAPWEVAGSPVPMRVLRAAALSDPQTVLAGVPTASRQEFLNVLAGRLTEGFRVHGWPKAMVRVTVVNDASGRHLGVAVEAGPKVVSGPIQVLGTPDGMRQAIILRLSEKPAKPATEPGSVTATAKEDPLWKVGEPLVTAKDSIERIRAAVLDVSQCHGHFTPRFTVDIPDDGSLQVVFTDLGPAAVWGRVEVTGVDAPVAAALRSWIGAVPGEPVFKDPGTDPRKDIEDRLRATARFVKRSVTLNPVVDAGRIDLTVAVVPARGVRPFPEPLEGVEAALLRIGTALERDLAAMKDNDYTAELKTPHLSATVVVAAGGVSASVRASETAPLRGFDMATAIDGHKVVVWGGAQKAGLRIVTASDAGFDLELRLSPSGEVVADGSDGLSVGANMETHSHGRTRLFSVIPRIDPVCMVIFAHRSDCTVKMADGRVRIHTSGGTDIVFDEASGRLLELQVRSAEDSLTVRSGSGSLQRSAKDIESHQGRWTDVADAPAPATRTMPAVLALASFACHEWAALPLPPSATSADLKIGAAAVAWMCESILPDLFSVPTDTQFAIPPLPGQSLAGIPFMIAAQVLQDLRPGTWPVQLARAGMISTTHQREALSLLSSLVDKDGAGPVGCLVTALLLDQIHHPAAAVFRDLARERLGRYDLEAAVLRPYADRILSRLATLPVDPPDSLRPDHRRMVAGLARIGRAEGPADRRLDEALRVVWDAGGRDQLAALITVTSPAAR